jgi:homoserine O-acetyltransferase
MRKLSRSAICAALLLVAASAAAQEQQFATLGDVTLESGEVLRNCRIGYRTFGTLNADRSNAILLPTWAGGTTEALSGSVGPGRLADSSKYFVILVDALSNGVSSSPSNSTEQPRMRFPQITIRDMVQTQHALLTKVLGLDHVKAVMGISMGGMQTFQWMVAYPEFMDKAIPIVGSPRQAPYDLLHWQTQIDAIVNDPAWNGGDYTRNPARGAEYQLSNILLTTPDYFNRTHTREQVVKELAQARTGTGGSDANNKIRQVEAMMAQNVAAPFGDSMEKAAAAVKAKTLVIVAKRDHTVTPGPAIEFARLMRAELLELDDECGHQYGYCEDERVRTAVNEFLAR